MGPVVGHLLGGTHKLVVDALAKVVDEGAARQDALLAVGAHPHHFTVHGDGSRQSKGHGKNMGGEGNVRCLLSPQS